MRRQRRKDHSLKVRLSYKARPCLFQSREINGKQQQQQKQDWACGSSGTAPA
jgi:hypothetical protein